jgi:hypothetical protein
MRKLLPIDLFCLGVMLAILVVAFLVKIFRGISP